ncbi:glycerol-3-phosphate dehydrogenase/oxidase [Abyssicoccus albus]|uniref:glycerol-3-phosphate dehydrogenase/oxidase n=1 Tax=Abyssicoccus albus TaxID=1817405 RepID=UPI00097E3BC5|nr:glycerol-3-phosphate dehydrogenase/oxidase [Abyssicoccus albus]AQL56268.1 glycerol-3-phosphate dehydrogenase [Abyssicoccus albus]
MSLTAIDRITRKEKMASTHYDVIIVGGGITGAGIALDAAQRGMKVALIEMQDFAAGTSSRSTKLVHGGLRYLKQFQIKVVSETGKERAIVYENGPHVTTPERMLLPMHKGGTFGKFSTMLGLTVYDFLAGVKKSERRVMLNKEETVEMEPLVKQQGLKGGGHYVEYKTDDARLTIEVMKKASEFVADILNYAKSTEFIYDQNKKITGIKVQDMLNNQTFHMTAHKVINATGPWVDEVRDADYSKNNKNLRLTKGVHIVFDESVFPLKQAVYFDTEKDGRMIFAIPRNGKAYVGTTDTFFEYDKASPKVTQEDRDYLMNAIKYMFPSVEITDADIESSWAGIRPLILEEGKDPSEISRKDEIWEGDSGLLTIAGGKLTGYRHMAEEIVDLLAKRLREEQQLKFKKCNTKKTPISGGDIGGSDRLEQFIEEKKAQAKDFKLTEEEGEYLTRLYGSNVDELFRIAHSVSNEDSFGLPSSVYAQVVYSIQHEMINKPVDFFIRRTGTLFFDIEYVERYKRKVIDAMKHLLNWDNVKTEIYTEELNKAIQEAKHATRDVK